VTDALVLETVALVKVNVTLVAVMLVAVVRVPVALVKVILLCVVTDVLMLVSVVPVRVKVILVAVALVAVMPVDVVIVNDVAVVLVAVKDVFEVLVKVLVKVAVVVTQPQVSGWGIANTILWTESSQLPASSWPNAATGVGTGVGARRRGSVSSPVAPSAAVLTNGDLPLICWKSCTLLERTRSWSRVPFCIAVASTCCMHGQNLR
jgi:hypothetical protein